MTISALAATVGVLLFPAAVTFGLGQVFDQTVEA